VDKTDLVLSLLLLANSRTSFRELGEKTGLSVPAVHKRIQALRDAGVLRAFTARVSMFSLNAITILILGKSEAAPIEGVHEKLGAHESVYWVTHAGGNYLVVGAYLRSISEMDACVAFVKAEAKMPDPTVAIVSLFPSPAEAPLTRLDYRIIAALHKDSRIPISEVAEKVGVSAKTASRRLSRMVANALVELSVEWYPDAANDIMTFYQLYLRPGTDARTAGARLLNKYGPNVLFFYAFSNLPNLIVTMVWTPSMRELKEIQAGFESEGLFENIVPNVLYTGYIFDTWRDTLLMENAKAADRRG